MPSSFADFTPEQIAYWVTEIRPILVRWREESMEKARQRALAHIRQGVQRRRHPGDQAADRTRAEIGED